MRRIRGRCRGERLLSMTFTPIPSLTNPRVAIESTLPNTHACARLLWAPGARFGRSYPTSAVEQVGRNQAFRLKLDALVLTPRFRQRDAGGIHVLSKVVGILLVAAFAIAAAQRDTTWGDRQPVCVCTGCRTVPAIGNDRQAVLLAEAYIRIYLGENVLSEYKPLRPFREERSRGGPFWMVVAAHSKRPDSLDGVEVLLDEAHGCLLFAGYSE